MGAGTWPRVFARREILVKKFRILRIFDGLFLVWQMRYWELFKNVSRLDKTYLLIYLHAQRIRTPQTADHQRRRTLRPQYASSPVFQEGKGAKAHGQQLGASLDCSHFKHNRHLVVPRSDIPQRRRLQNSFDYSPLDQQQLISSFKTTTINSSLQQIPCWGSRKISEIIWLVYERRKIWNQFGQYFSVNHSFPNRTRNILHLPTLVDPAEDHSDSSKTE